MTDIADLLTDLVRIDSINPDLVPGAAGEGDIACFIAAWAERAGLDVHVVEPIPGRPSVVAVARGTGGGRSLMLNGHIDTVGVAGMAEPFSGRVEAGKLYGRGAYDMKGGVAACLWAAAQATGRRLRGDVVVTCVADEEVASLGMQAVLAHGARTPPSSPSPPASASASPTKASCGWRWRCTGAPPMAANPTWAWTPSPKPDTSSPA